VGLFTELANIFYTNLSVSELKALDLSGCHIGNDGARAIASALLLNGTFRCLNLTRNRIVDLGATALALALGRYTLTAQEMEFHEHLLSEAPKQKISDEGGGLLKGKKPKRATPRQMKKVPPTKTLNPMNVSSDPNTPVIAALMLKWRSVVVGSDDTKVLIGNSTLTTLLLEDNFMTGIGLAHFAAMLQMNQRLVTFSVDGNPDLSPAAGTSHRPLHQPPCERNVSDTVIVHHPRSVDLANVSSCTWNVN
jgi:hypothetical protein